jgi:hypothetical protein
VNTRRSILAAALLAPLLAAGPAAAAPWAFVSTSGTGNAALRVLDLDTMAFEPPIAGVGDEPSKLAANADRTRLWLASWRFNGSTDAQRGMVYAIDTRLRAVVGAAEVGRRQNRALAVSPDGTRLYSWKETFDGTTVSFGVAVLDTASLAEIATVPLPVATCRDNAQDLLAHPDGRVLLSGCTDGLRVLDPASLAVTVVAPTPFVGRLVGLSPDGGEAYASTGANANTLAGVTGLRAIRLADGQVTEFAWQLAAGSPNFPSNSRAFSMLAVQRPADPPGQPIHLFTWASANGNAPVAWATPADLLPPATTRRLVGTATVGPVEAIAADASGMLALGARFGALQKLDLAPATGSAPLAAIGAPLAVAGVAALTDLVIVPWAPDRVFANGFEP